MNHLFGDHDKVLVYVTFAIILVLTLGAIFFTDSFSALWSGLNGFICTSFGWFYLLIALVTIFFCFAIAFSKIGKLKLGKDDDKPEHSTFSWIAMLFSAGMGVALYFYCISEPLSHYYNPPYLVEAQTPEAIINGMAIMIMHNGIHGWAMFCLVGLGIGFAAYRLGLPLSYSSSLYGLIGNRVNGPWGKVINLLCVVTTFAGLSTSLGMGVLSISALVSNVTGLEITLLLELGVLLVIGAVFILSVSSGLKKGMALISDWNVYLAIALGLFVFICGPSVAILNLGNETLGHFLHNFFYMSLFSDYAGQTDGWLNGWTVFYWAWWIAWSAYIGGFLARISKGRTIRQFMIFGMLMPTALCFIWLTCMAGYGFGLDGAILDSIYNAIQTQGNEAALALMIGELPFAKVISVIVIINLILFIATSADAGSTYAGIIFSKGNPNPKAALKITCAALMLALSMALIIGGGLKSLQTMSIVMALPIAILAVGIMISILKMASGDIGFGKDKQKPTEE